MSEPEVTLYCSFCGKSHKEVLRLVSATSSEARICNICVLVAAHCMLDPRGEIAIVPGDPETVEGVIT